MRQAVISVDLHRGWEEWIVTVPDDVDPENMTMADVEGFDELVDAGNDGMTLTESRELGR